MSVSKSLLEGEVLALFPSGLVRDRIGNLTEDGVLLVYSRELEFMSFIEKRKVVGCKGVTV